MGRNTGNKGDPRLEFNSFQLLYDVWRVMLKNYPFSLTKDLQEESISRLKELLQMHPGNQMLNFVAYDNKEQIKLQMPSGRQKVKVSQKLLSELENQDVLFIVELINPCEGSNLIISYYRFISYSY